jgi:ATP-dependent Clp protease ATP-binding subunit ClpA
MTHNKVPTNMPNLALQPHIADPKRVDNVVGIFPSINLTNLDKNTNASLTVSVARQELVTLEACLASMGIDLNVSDDILTLLAKNGIDDVTGARTIQKTIEQHLELPISQAVLKGQFVSGDTIGVAWIDGVLTLSK